MIRRWCPEGDLNPHDRLRSADFKSAVSADFTIRAMHFPSTSYPRCEPGGGYHAADGFLAAAIEPDTTHDTSPCCAGSLERKRVAQCRASIRRTRAHPCNRCWRATAELACRPS